jgi:hypothetical protein
MSRTATHSRAPRRAGDHERAWQLASQPREASHSRGRSSRRHRAIVHRSEPHSPVDSCRTSRSTIHRSQMAVGALFVVLERMGSKSASTTRPRRMNHLVPACPKNSRKTWRKNFRHRADEPAPADEAVLNVMGQRAQAKPVAWPGSSELDQAKTWADAAPKRLTNGARR